MGHRWGIALFAMALSLLFPALPTAARTTSRSPASGWLVDRWTLDDGLPLSHVEDVAQTPDGNVWLATFDGLVRFDGLEVRIHRRADTPELLTNRLYNLEVGDDGALWIAGETGKLIRMTADGFSSWSLPRPQEGRTLWLWKGRGRVLALYDEVYLLGDGAPEVLGRGLSPGPLRVLDGTRSGDLWVNGNSDILHHLPVTGAPQGLSLLGLYAREPHGRPFVMDDGAVYITSAHGLLRVDGDEVVRLPGPRGAEDDPFLQVLEGPSGEVLARSSTRWWGVSGGRLVPPVAPTAPPGPINSRRLPALFADGHLWEHSDQAIWRDGVRLAGGIDRVNRLFVDDMGHLWVAAEGQGLLRLRPSPVLSLGHSDGLGDGNVRAVSIDGSGDFWVSEGDAGVVRIGAGGATRIAVTGTSVPDAGAKITAYPPILLRDGRVWIPSNGGICQVDGDRCVPLPPLGDMNWQRGPGYQDATGKIWYSNITGGLWNIEEQGGSWTSRRVAGGGDLGSDTVRMFAEAPDGSVLIATRDRGLVRYRSGERESFSPDPGLGSVGIRFVTVDRGGVAWLGTDDSGLCRVGLGQDGMTAGPRVCVSRAAGLPDDTIHSVAEDRLGRIWLSSNRGISILERAVLEAYFSSDRDHVLALTLDQSDGMASGEANGYMQPALAGSPDGLLWYPTQVGLSGVRPESFPTPPPPRAAIETITYGDRTVDPSDIPERIVLEPEERGFSVRWHCPELVWPEDVRFRYRLAGFDDAWSAPGAGRVASWTNLPPGGYTFEVQAGLLDWGEPVRLDVHRRPAFNETWMFIALLVFAGLVLVGALAWQRTRRLRRRKRELEVQVREATALLKAREGTLEDQARRLEETDRMKTRFLANVSHELKTPIALVLGPLEDLAACLGGTGGEELRTLDVIRRNATRLHELIGQLVKVALLDGSAMRLRTRRQDFAAFVRRTVERFEVDAADRGLDFAADTGPGELSLYFDADLMETVLSNLVTNALQHTPRGGRVLVSTHGPAPGQEEDGWGTAYVTLTVLNTGPGIPVAARERIFERFCQVPRQGWRPQGMGIGLSLCRELVELHGGQIGFDDAEGTGCRFLVRLPMGVQHLTLDQLEAEASGGAVPSAEIQGDGEDRGEDEPLVLVVEDNEDMRSYLASHLTGLGRVAQARDGREALEFVRRERPRVVVSDIMMPRMDGLELAAAIRSNPQLAEVRVVLISARSGPGASAEGLAVADDYLAKPFGIKDLLSRVRNQIVRSGVDVAAGTSAVTAAGAESPEGIKVTPAGRVFWEKFRSIVLVHLADPEFSVPALAREMALSPRQLQRRCREATGFGPVQLVRQLRLEEARSMLRSGEFDTSAEVAARVGMSASYFSQVYSAWYGHPPSGDRVT
ncbi:MAG: ATP-binding protein [Pseudomonadota bacterium]